MHHCLPFSFPGEVGLLVRDGCKSVILETCRSGGTMFRYGPVSRSGI